MPGDILEERMKRYLFWPLFFSAATNILESGGTDLYFLAGAFNLITIVVWVVNIWGYFRPELDEIREEIERIEMRIAFCEKRIANPTEAQVPGYYERMLTISQGELEKLKERRNRIDHSENT